MGKVTLGSYQHDWKCIRQRIQLISVISFYKGCPDSAQVFLCLWDIREKSENISLSVARPSLGGQAPDGFGITTLQKPHICVHDFRTE